MVEIDALMSQIDKIVLMPKHRGYIINTCNSHALLESGMANQPRQFKDLSDIILMQDLLRAGLLAETNSHYCHPGELIWWLYNWLALDEPWQDIYLWENPQDSSRLLAWGLIMAPWSAMEVYLQPGLGKSKWFKEINKWMEHRLLKRAHETGEWPARYYHVAETDSALRTHLTQAGFTEDAEDILVDMTLDLQGWHPGRYTLPEGYLLQRVSAENIERRARAQHEAFGRNSPWDKYYANFRVFLTNPFYNQCQDWIMTAPDGRPASICTIWPDPASGIAEIEPIGTHPDFQKKGFGRMVMDQAIQAVQSEGMNTVRLSVREDNAGARGLYESVGFKVHYRMLIYNKSK